MSAAYASRCCTCSRGTESPRKTNRPGRNEPPSGRSFLSVQHRHRNSPLSPLSLRELPRFLPPRFGNLSVAALIRRLSRASTLIHPPYFWQLYSSSPLLSYRFNSPVPTCDSFQPRFIAPLASNSVWCQLLPIRFENFRVLRFPSEISFFLYGDYRLSSRRGLVTQDDSLSRANTESKRTCGVINGGEVGREKFAVSYDWIAKGWTNLEFLD